MAIPSNTNATPPSTSTQAPSSPQAAPVQKKRAKFQFLEQNKSVENLTQLANPKLSTDPSISCITKEIYDTLPYFNSSPQTIRNRTVNLILSATLLKLLSQLGWRTNVCVTMHENWTEQFFTLSSECFEKTIHRMLETDALLWTFFLTSVIGLSAFSIHVASRIVFKDTKAETRLQMLHREYDDMIQTITTKSSNQERSPEERQAMRKLAYSLKANIPLINERLKKIARLEPEQADLVTNQLSKAIERVLHPNAALCDLTQRAK